MHPSTGLHWPADMTMEICTYFLPFAECNFAHWSGKCLPPFDVNHRPHHSNLIWAFSNPGDVTFCTVPRTSKLNWAASSGERFADVQIVIHVKMYCNKGRYICEGSCKIVQITNKSRHSLCSTLWLTLFRGWCLRTFIKHSSRLRA